ncbi:hypothetical protein [Microbacterium sp. A93]|uniref:hypothetical protein n=1 Tax=unclassified Microbacterium TaxID=2609290 RepID=UPI003F42EA14
MITIGGASEWARTTASRLARSAVSPAAVPAWIALAVAGVALVGVVTFGGLDRSDPIPAELTVGEEARVSLYAVTVLDAELTDSIEEEFLEAEPGETLLVATVLLENLSDRPVGVGVGADRVQSQLISASNPLIELADVEQTSSPRVWRDDGSAGSVILQPGVASEVRIAWTVPDDALPDGDFQLNVHDAAVSTGKILLASDHITWKRGDISARISATAGSTP